MAHAYPGEGQVVIDDCRNAIEELHAESEKIGGVLDVINSIAEQPNVTTREFSNNVVAIFSVSAKTNDNARK